MSISSKIVVQTENKDIFEICNIVSKSLQPLSVVNPKNKRIKKTVNMEIFPFLEMVTARFDVGDENERLLHIHFGCDLDHEAEISGPKIILSIGSWGKNKLIIDTLAEALLKYGKTFVMYDDCTEEVFKEFNLLAKNTKDDQSFYSELSSASEKYKKIAGIG